MNDSELFASAIREQGDLGGVFEHDGVTGFFYLFDTAAPAGHGIQGAIKVTSGAHNLRETELEVRWSASGESVGLFISGTLWAAFDARSRQGFGGGYRPDEKPCLPLEVAREFEAPS